MTHGSRREGEPFLLPPDQRRRTAEQSRTHRQGTPPKKRSGRRPPNPRRSRTRATQSSHLHLPSLGAQNIHKATAPWRARRAARRCHPIRMDFGLSSGQWVRCGCRGPQPCLQGGRTAPQGFIVAGPDLPTKVSPGPEQTTGTRRAPYPVANRHVQREPAGERESKGEHTPQI